MFYINASHFISSFYIFFQLPFDSENPQPLIISKAYEYKPDELFNIRAKPEGELAADEPHYVYRLPLQVLEPEKAGTVARLRAEIGYRFLLG